MLICQFTTGVDFFAFFFFFFGSPSPNNKTVEKSTPVQFTIQSLKIEEEKIFYHNHYYIDILLFVHVFLETLWDSGTLKISIASQNVLQYHEN